MQRDTKMQKVEQSTEYSELEEKKSGYYQMKKMIGYGE